MHTPRLRGFGRDCMRSRNQSLSVSRRNQNKTSDPKLQDHNQKGLTLFPNWQGRPRRLLGARKRILAQHLLKRG